MRKITVKKVFHILKVEKCDKIEFSTELSTFSTQKRAESVDNF